MVKQVWAYGLVAGLVCLTSVLLTTPQAEAARRAIGNGKVCRFEGKNPHYHISASRYMALREAALAKAIRKWDRFAAWEYGKAWGNFHNAERKSIDCATGVTGRKWKCAVKGQPCRP